MNSIRREIVQHFEKFFNFRDIGGLKTEDGYMMKTGIRYHQEFCVKCRGSLI